MRKFLMMLSVAAMPLALVGCDPPGAVPAPAASTNTASDATTTPAMTPGNGAMTPAVPGTAEDGAGNVQASPGKDEGPDNNATPVLDVDSTDKPVDVPADGK